MDTSAALTMATGVDLLRLEAVGLNKTFGSSRVLKDVDVSVRPREVHALVGQNGSGKSTFIKVLSGHYSADSGSFAVDGNDLRLPVSPRDLRRAGISVLHQDFGLVEQFSVVENIRINNFRANPRTRGISWRHEIEVVGKLLAELNCHVDPRAKVGTLGPVDRARVAIARALQLGEGHDAAKSLAMLVFDESTRALPKDALDEFYAELRGLIDGGASVLLVSHNLEEVVNKADRVTVLRDGEVVAGGLPTKETTERDLVKLMLGYSIHGRRADKGGRAAPAAGDVIEARGVSGRTVRDIDLRLEPGEIVGITGLEGSGFEELPYLITGAVPAHSGELSIGGTALSLTVGNPQRFIDRGVFLVPERREVDGLALGESMMSNITLPRVGKRGARHRLGSVWQMDEAVRAIDLLDIKPRAPFKPVGHLSGGNQQKVQLAKWLLGNAALMVLHEPTQGVDVGARRDIVEALTALAAGGGTVVVATMELELLEELCHRVVVFREGRISTVVEDVSVQALIDTVYDVPSATAERSNESAEEGRSDAR